MLETNDIRISARQEEVRSLLLASITAIETRIADVDAQIDEFSCSSNDATLVKCLRLSKLRRETGDDSVQTKIALFTLSQRFDEPGWDLVALRASLSTRLNALNNKLESHPPISYVAPAPVERPPVEKAIPSPSEWAEQRLAKLETTEVTEEQRSRFEQELERIASKDKVTLSRDLEDGDRQSDPSVSSEGFEGF